MSDLLLAEPVQPMTPIRLAPEFDGLTNLLFALVIAPSVVQPFGVPQPQNEFQPLNDPPRRWLHTANLALD